MPSYRVYSVMYIYSDENERGTPFSLETEAHRENTAPADNFGVLYIGLPFIS